MIRAVPLLAIAAAAACSNSTAPAATGMTLSFSSRSPAAASTSRRSSLSPSFAVTVAGGGNTVVITRAQLVLRKIELKRTAGATCPDTTVRDDSCEELEVGPILVDLPLTDGISAPLSVNVPAGQYHEMEMKVHKPGNDARDAAFKVANPAFADISIRVEGTFNGTPFVYTSRVDEELELEFNPTLVVGATGGNVTIQIGVATWFMNTSGTVVDPNTANVGGINAGTVEARIKQSIRALEDDNRDGR